jgi:hypothetical protein
MTNNHTFERMATPGDLSSNFGLAWVVAYERKISNIYSLGADVLTYHHIIGSDDDYSMIVYC